MNISLDTLDPTLFGKITRLGRLEHHGRHRCGAGWAFGPVKVNCVVVRRLNQDVAALARLTVDRPIHLRFIEYMPIGDEHTLALRCGPACSALNPELWDASDTVPSDELRVRINAGATAAGLGELEPLDINDAPAGALRLSALSGRGGNSWLYQRYVQPFLRELQPSAPDGRWQRASAACSAMPSIRCARRSSW